MNNLQVVKAQFPEGYVGTACELGAADGVFLSNTLKLEEAGWDCLCIEGNPFYTEDLFANRKKPLICGVGNMSGLALFHQYESEGELAWAAASGLKPRGGFYLARPPFMVPVMPLSRILHGYKMTDLDFLSLDVEGREIDVLRSLNHLRPKTILVEIVDDHKMETHKLLVEMGYSLVDATGQDAFYALK